MVSKPMIFVLPMQFQKVSYFVSVSINILVILDYEEYLEFIEIQGLLGFSGQSPQPTEDRVWGRIFHCSEIFAFFFTKVSQFKAYVS